MTVKKLLCEDVPHPSKRRHCQKKCMTEPHSRAHYSTPLAKRTHTSPTGNHHRSREAGKQKQRTFRPSLARCTVRTDPNAPDPRLAPRTYRCIAATGGVSSGQTAPPPSSTSRPPGTTARGVKAPAPPRRPGQRRPRQWRLRVGHHQGYRQLASHTYWARQSEARAAGVGRSQGSRPPDCGGHAPRAAGGWRSNKTDLTAKHVARPAAPSWVMHTG